MRKITEVGFFYSIFPKQIENYVFALYLLSGLIVQFTVRTYSAKDGVYLFTTDSSTPMGVLMNSVFRDLLIVILLE